MNREAVIEIALKFIGLMLLLESLPTLCVALLNARVVWLSVPLGGGAFLWTLYGITLLLAFVGPVLVGLVFVRRSGPIAARICRPVGRAAQQESTLALSLALRLLAVYFIINNLHRGPQVVAIVYHAAWGIARGLSSEARILGDLGVQAEGHYVPWELLLLDLRQLVTGVVLLVLAPLIARLLGYFDEIWARPGPPGQAAERC